MENRLFKNSNSNVHVSIYRRGTFLRPKLYWLAHPNLTNFQLHHGVIIRKQKLFVKKRELVNFPPPYINQSFIYQSAFPCSWRQFWKRSSRSSADEFNAHRSLVVRPVVPFPLFIYEISSRNMLKTVCRTRGLFNFPTMYFHHTMFSTRRAHFVSQTTQPWRGVWRWARNCHSGICPEIAFCIPCFEWKSIYSIYIIYIWLNNPLILSYLRRNLKDARCWRISVLVSFALYSGCFPFCQTNQLQTGGVVKRKWNDKVSPPIKRFTFWPRFALVLSKVGLNLHLGRTAPVTYLPKFQETLAWWKSP